jgi:Zn-dependent peptidase ImmA (M78 family)
MQRRKHGSWTGPVSQILARISNFDSPESLFIQKVEELQRSNPQISGPPFDPRKYAEALGILIHEKENMALDGILSRSKKGRFVITLKKNVNPSRKNFTIAHEVAHTFFFDLLNKTQYRGRSNKFDPQEERLCDIAAAELLMPRRIFRSDLGGTLSPARLIELQDRYQVSLQAVAIRAAQVMKNVACSIWQKQGSAINLDWITPRYLNKLLLCQTGHSSIEQALFCRNRTFAAFDSFYGAEPGHRTLANTTALQFGSGRVLAVISLCKPNESIKKNGRNELEVERALTPEPPDYIPHQLSLFSKTYHSRSNPLWPPKSITRKRQY